MKIIRRKINFFRFFICSLEKKTYLCGVIKTKRKEMKTKKPFSAEQELGAYRVRITENSATLETFTKDWRVVFSTGTNMAFHVIQHFKEKSWKELEVLAYALYAGSVLTVLDAPFLGGLGKLFDEYQARQEAKAAELPAGSDTEEEIIQQEQHKQEFKEQLLNGNK